MTLPLGHETEFIQCYSGINPVLQCKVDIYNFSLTVTLSVYACAAASHSKHPSTTNRYRMQVPSLLTAFAFAGALASVLVLLALPPAFGTDDVLIQVCKKADFININGNHKNINRASGHSSTNYTNKSIHSGGKAEYCFIFTSFPRKRRKIMLLKVVHYFCPHL